MRMKATTLNRITHQEFQRVSQENKPKKGEWKKKIVRNKKWPCYQCGGYGYFIAKCPNKKDKDKEDDIKNKYKKDERNQEYKKSYEHKHKKKYQRQAHLGMEWASSEEESEDERVSTIAIKKPSSLSTRLFPNLSNSDDEDHADHSFMAKGTKVKSKSSSSTHSSSDRK